MGAGEGRSDSTTQPAPVSSSSEASLRLKLAPLLRIRLICSIASLTVDAISTRSASREEKNACASGVEFNKMTVF
jgi:hypothetical protein